MRTKQQEAYTALKIQMTDLMFKFTLKYAAKGPDCIYPQCGAILVDVLQDCLDEAKSQIGQDPDDEPDEEDDEEVSDDTPYMAYRKVVAACKDEMSTLEAHIRDVEVTCGDAQRAAQVGLQNVYDKFVELEKRQIEIEELLKSDRIIEIINKIPTERDIKKMLAKVENTDLAKLTKNIDEMRENLQDMVDRFTW